MQTRLSWLFGLSVVLTGACDRGSKPASAPAPAVKAAVENTKTAGDSGATAVEPEEAGTQPDASLANAELPKNFAKLSNEFGFDLYAKARMSARGQDFALSPASISLALGMVLAGSRGTSATQLATLLHLEGPPEALHEDASVALAQLNNPAREDNRLHVVNRMWADKTTKIESPYATLLESKYRAELSLTDFRGAPEPARDSINAWVAGQTEDRIQDLLPPNSITAASRLVLVNAIYFLGSWATAFDKANTLDAPFTLSYGKTVQVPLMVQAGQIRHAKSDKVELVDLPYRGDELSMTLLLPAVDDGLETLEASLDAATYTGWIEQLETKAVELYLPRFELRTTISLSEQLEALGMRDLFNAKTADLTGLSNPANIEERLHISEAYHQVFVAVDEKGTEAAAATAIAMGYGGRAPVGIQVRFDRPFVFVIRERSSGLILFMGRVLDPR